MKLQRGEKRSVNIKAIFQPESYFRRGSQKQKLRRWCQQQTNKIQRKTQESIS